MKRTLTCLLLIGATCATAQQTEPYSAEQALATFQHDPAVRVELVASEPLVFDPVALCFDAHGRLYVVENRGYPTDADPPRGDVVLLEDTDGDGRMDTRTIFAEGFDFPNGIMAWRDGVLLTCAPDVLYLKDTDGDGHADVREVQLTGFAPGGSTQLRTSHPTLNVDGWIYFTNGLSGGEVHRPSTPADTVKMGTLDLRWNPWDGRIETTAGQAQFGQAFDDFGNKFVCSNRKHIQQVMLQPADLARNPYTTQTETVADIPDHDEAAKLFPLSSNITTAYSHTGTFTAACGLAIYRGGALGPAFYGNAFVCDPTGNLVHRDILDPTQGAAYVARRAYPDREFLASPDNWFRPVFLANGPDGALYLCDMYRKTIEHPVYLPPEIAAKTDFQTGRDKGRIYRITASDAPKSTAPNPMDALDDDALAIALGDTNGWRRDAAFRLTLEHSTDDLEVRARKLLDDQNVFRRTYGIRLLQVLGIYNDDDLQHTVADKDVLVRATTISEWGGLSPGRLGDKRAVRTKLIGQAIEQLNQDPDPRVRFRAFLKDLYVDKNVAKRWLVDAMLREYKDPWMVAAALSSARSGESSPKAVSEELMRRLISLETQLPSELYPVIESLARLAALSKRGSDQPSPYFTVPLLVFDSTSALEKPWRIAALLGILEDERVDTRDLDFPQTRFDHQFPSATYGDAPKRIADYAKRLASDRSAGDGERVLAIRLLGYMDYKEVGDLLGALLSPGVSEELQTVAIHSLGGMREKGIGRLFVAPNAWNSATGATRVALRSAVLNQRIWLLWLLQAMERGEISPYTLDPTSRAQILKIADPDIAALAQKLFANLDTGDRDKVFDDHKPLLALSGNRDTGHAVYTNTCAQCHVFQGEGHKVGPDLSDIRAQTPDYILLHVLNPNKAVTAGYESYTVSTKALETYTGILAAQNDATITLRQALGVEQTVPRADIDALTTENRSLMPDELEKALTDQQLRDLIAFLKGE